MRKATAASYRRLDASSAAPRIKRRGERTAVRRPVKPVTPLDAFVQIRRLREEAEAYIERLINFLDATQDTDADAGGDDFACDVEDERESDYADDEEHEPSGIADHDGLMEQVPQQFEHTDIGVEQ